MTKSFACAVCQFLVTNRMWKIDIKKGWGRLGKSCKFEALKGYVSRKIPALLRGAYWRDK